MLAARTGKKPLLLLLDEAHTLDAGVGHALLNASQIVGRKQPFLLALAGTPHLESRLSEMDVSFWSRSELLPIGRLDAGATAAALRLPLAGENVAVDDDALAQLVAASQGYPYFVQLLGEALWRRVVAGGPAAGRRLTRTDIEAVRADFEQKRGRYYLQRYNELQDQGLLPAARAVAEAFEKRERLDGAQLEAAVRRGLGEAGQRAADGGDGGDGEDPGSPGLHLAARRRAHLGSRHPEPHGLRADARRDARPGRLRRR